MHHVHHSNTSNSNRCTHIYAPLCFRCMVNQYCNCNVCIYICQTVEKLSSYIILYVHMYMYVYISESSQTCNTLQLHICTCIRNTLYVCCHGQLLILIKIAMVRMYVLHDHNAPLLPSGTFPLKFANH
jgi:hypothetical protein